ncbi:acetylornithine deacetylase [Aeribacillus alveayuensis]|uniref:Acetylornithine deacetylase n=1 Tax=Aeribacillus alveayuensis TaxID=279215 RepID=A0ABT9VS34_9BACI|nr:acetylornithine deacetylase [Bacillus alveayuensis]
MEHDKILDELFCQIEEREEELLDLVKKLVSFQTPSPPARNAYDAQQYVALLLKEVGFHVDQWYLYENDPVVVGTKKGTAPFDHYSLIINGHMDVASVEDSEGWNTPPFEGIVKDSYIYGRGVADMKGGLAGALFAIKLLDENGIKPGGDLIFESVVGEEVGEAGTKSCCDRGYSADFAVVVDTSNCEIQGQGGVITGWVTIQSPKTFHDATRRKMIHAGGKLFGASAIEKMMKVIEGLKELEQHWAVMKTSAGFPPGSTTINPAVIEGGRHAAFVADKCALWITVHYYPEQHYEEVIEEIEEHIKNVAKADPWLREHPPTFIWGGSSMIEDRGEIFPAFSIDEKWPGVQVLKRAHKRAFQEDVKLSMSPTVTDGGWLSEAGIPVVLYGPGTLEEAHAVNEKLSIEQLKKFTKSMTAFLLEWYQKKR